MDRKATNRPLTKRGRSTSEIFLRNIHRSHSWTDTLPIHRSKLSISLQNSDQNLLSLPKIDDYQRRFSNYSDGDVPEQPFSLFDSDSMDSDLSKSMSKLNSSRKIPMKKSIHANTNDKKTKQILPIVAIIPPDEDVLFLTQ